MIRPTEELLKSLTQLNLNGDFINFVTWLEDNLDKQDIDNRVAIELAPLYRGQGKSLLLDELISLIKDSRKILNHKR